MRLSRYFLPVAKETPADAQIVSHKLMLRAGLVRQTAAGIYAWLPLGLRVMNRIADIVRQEQNRAGAVEMLMPTIQSADLWRQSGRFDAYGPEMLRFKDRHKREMLYGPTNEEMITAIFRDGVRSYRDLPRTLYHIQWKFRDEVRPRFGVMRGREFLMKDAYSFDLTYDDALFSYTKMLLAYLRTYQRLGLTAVAMRAETGPIGGTLSHEFIILAPNGESQIYYDSDYASFDWVGSHLSYRKKGDLSAFVQLLDTMYGRTEEMHDPELWSRVDASRRREGRGIEVGHIFYFGTKYSETMGLSVQNAAGEHVRPQMGSYGIGVSRLVGAIIEASHDDAGIIWPVSVAPYKFGLINMRADDPMCSGATDRLYFELGHGRTLYDDREDRAGAKLASMDLVGIPLQIIVGPRGLSCGTVELKSRKTGKRVSVSPELAPIVAKAFISGRFKRLNNAPEVYTALRELGCFSESNSQ